MIKKNISYWHGMTTGSMAAFGVSVGLHRWLGDEFSDVAVPCVGILAICSLAIYYLGPTPQPS
jgi:hypothetical protein